ncbi:hypothetical protein CPB86DRAFT_694304 [Serendipita vermifera]|nr:hypothetical protein CPB86DRAFT_694304 [Serendipita vermifera]
MRLVTRDIPPAVIAELVATFTNMNASRFTCGAGLVVMLYDWCLTIGTEVEVIWMRKKSLSSILFLVNRYLPVPFLLMFNYREAFQSSFVFLSTAQAAESRVPPQILGVSLAISTWLLSLRVISLFNQHKWIIYSIYTFYFSAHITTWILTAIALHAMYPTIKYFAPVKVCGANSVSIIGVTYFIPIGLELYVFSLQIYHHFRHTRMRRKLNLPTTTLLRTLYQDGYVYFIVILHLRLMTCLVWAVAPGSLWYMANQLEFAMMVALVSRFHLNLRSVATPSGPVTFSNTMTAASSFGAKGRQKFSIPRVLQRIKGEEISSWHGDVEEMQVRRSTHQTDQPIPSSYTNEGVSVIGKDTNTGLSIDAKGTNSFRLSTQTHLNRVKYEAP